MTIELVCWATGVSLIAMYFGATIGFESERRQGIELFTQAQAAAQAASAPAPESAAGVAQTVDQHKTPGATAAAETASLPVALLRMPGVGLEVPVFDDISERNLSRGAGWIPGTALPNDGGNMAIAAHRDQYFRALKDVAIGDLLELESLSGPRNYKVTSLTIVQPEDLWPLDPADVATVTLVTCYPFYFVGSAPQRFIVQAVAVDQEGS
ncbi:MAG: class D sortase [Wenzhouxiangellaceae bacterium]|nr:class D sortase [Wenzhouxiangellaceae bacterium]